MNTVKKVLVLLGNENDMACVLSEAAMLRADAAVSFLQENPDYVVIPTGAFGEHFNRTDTPHGRLLAGHLVRRGIAEDRILPHTKSSNTLEDALGVLRAIEQMGEVERIRVITSRFHMPRTRFIFGRVLQDYDLQFDEAADPIDRRQLAKAMKYESVALEKIRREWVDVASFDLDRCPAEAHQSLGAELRHYDTISYFAIAGAFLVAAFAIQAQVEVAVPISWFVAIGGAVALVFLWYLYLRLASTAGSARRVLIIIEKLHGLPGISSTAQRTKFLGVNVPVKHAVSTLFALVVLLLVLLPVLRSLGG